MHYVYHQFRNHRHKRTIPRCRFNVVFQHRIVRSHSKLQVRYNVSKFVSNDASHGFRVIPGRILAFHSEFRAVLGADRKLHKSKTAKLGPYCLICVASCLFTIVSRNLPTFAAGHTDPTRISSAVVTGVGFIGAGFIIKLNNNIIVGMTNASIIWLSAGVGMGVGFGYYILSSYTVVLVLFILNTGRVFHFLKKEKAVAKDDEDEIENKSLFINV